MLIFFVSLVLLVAFIFLVKILLRKIFHIKKVKKEFFSYNHINSLHSKIDWFLRIATMIVNITFLYGVIFKEYSFNLFLGAMLILLILQFMVQAFFEWRYSENPKEAILTVSEMLIFTIVIGATILFDLLNFLVDAPVQ